MCAGIVTRLQIPMKEVLGSLLSSMSSHVGDVSANAADAQLPPSLASRREQMFPKLAPAEIDRLRRFGEIHSWQPGELLFEVSKAGPGMFVLLNGHVLVTRKNCLGIEVPIIENGPGDFMAEIGQLS